MSSNSAPGRGPRGLLLLGSLLDVRRDKLAFVVRATREHGDLVVFRMGPRRRLILVNHPDHARHVLRDNAAGYEKGIGLEQAKPALGEGLLTSEGDVWAYQRRALQPAFHHDRFEAYAAGIAQSAEAMLDRWETAAGRIDVAREVVRFAIDALGRTLLATDLEPFSERLTPALDEVSRWAMRRMTALLRPPLAWPSAANLRCRRALRELDRIADDLLARRQVGSGGRDLLSILTAGEGPPRMQAASHLRASLVTLLLAGHETSAATLAWSCHLLANHPDVQRRVREEATAVLGMRRPVAQDLPRLSYTRMVVEETLRLYPPVWMITRRALRADRIGGQAVPAGSDILISVYTLHRHRDFWPEPEEFRPERFVPRSSDERPPQAFLPFGLGPRSCLGSGFSLMEATIALAMIVRRYRLASIPGLPVDPDPLLTLRPKNGLPLRLEAAAPDGELRL